MIDSITGLDIFSTWTMLVRLLSAMAASFIIGFERSKHNQPAGMRTHMALALGSCGIMILSILLPIKFANIAPNGDPGRMAAQVISGIGFLGAGAIFRFGFTVKGLTTAASVWTISGIGLIFGAGFYTLGWMCTAMLFVILQLIDDVEDIIVDKKDMRVLSVLFSTEHITVGDVAGSIKDQINIRNMSIQENVGKQEIEMKITCRMSEDQSIRELFE
ncbi:MAG: MgtC/SapB family protein, partial [Spirochaetota bacterium]